MGGVATTVIDSRGGGRGAGTAVAMGTALGAVAKQRGVGGAFWGHFGPF